MTMHDYLRNELAAFLSGDLDERSAAAVREHLATCAECNRELDALRTVWRALGSAPDEVPGERLSARFYDALHAYEESLREADRRASEHLRGSAAAAEARRWADTSGWPDWVRRLAWLLPRHPAAQFALVLAVLIVGGFIGYRLHGDGSGELVQLREEIRSVNRLLVVSLLQQQSAAERLQGVSWSYKAPESDPEIASALLQTLSQDPNVNVRLAALDALSRRLDQASVRGGLITALEKQDSPIIQLAIVDVVVQSDMKESDAALRRILGKPGVNETVKRRIEQALDALKT